MGREISKMHEEFLRGRVSEIFAQLADREVRGELTLVVRGCAESEVSQEELSTEARGLLQAGMSVNRVAGLLSERYGISKREIYQMALKLKNQQRDEEAH